MNLVLDCSYITSVILPDEEEKVRLDFDLYRLYAPSVFFLECSSAVVNALKRNRINEKDLEESFLDLSKVPITIDKFSATLESALHIAKLSLKYNLSPYDASYLELAIRMKAELATFDKALANAARNCGLKVLTYL